MVDTDRSCYQEPHVFGRGRLSEVTEPAEQRFRLVTMSVGARHPVNHHGELVENENHLIAGIGTRVEQLFSALLPCRTKLLLQLYPDLMKLELLHVLAKARPDRPGHKS